MADETIQFRLYLIRHGEIDGHAEHRLYGHTDVRLSDRGRDQSSQIAELLSDRNIKAVYSSDLSRAGYAAELISAKHNCSLTKLPNLREINMGQWEGLSMTEIKNMSPELVDMLYQNPFEFTYPDGESFSEFENRIISTLAQIQASHTSGTIAIVAHGGVCRMILAHVLEMPARNWLRISQDYGCINVVEWFGDFPIVRAMNFTGELHD